MILWRTGRLPIRKIKEVLRLKLDCGISEREISRSCSLSRSTVAEYVRRAIAAGMNWQEVVSLTDTQIEERLFPPQPTLSTIQRPQPDCEDIYNQLRTYRKFNLTLAQLWLEYKEKHPDGYQYSQWCDLYRRWRKKLDYCIAPGAPGWREGLHRLLRWSIHHRPGYRRIYPHPDRQK